MSKRGGSAAISREQDQTLFVRLDYAYRNQDLEQRSRWFHLTRPERDAEMERIRDVAFEYKRKLIERQKTTADHKAGYNPGGAGSPWFSVGPRNVNGRVRCLAVHPTMRDLVYCGSASGGVWKSIDGGQVWRSLWDMQESLAVGAIGIAPSNPDTVYVGTGEGLIAGTYGSGHNFPGAGIYVSIDAGATWARRASVTNRRITQLLVAPNNAQRIYVAGQSGFEGSSDGGVTWTTLKAGQVSDAVIDPNNSSNLYIAIQGDGVYKSTDQGANWAQLNNAPTGAAAQWPKLAIGMSGAHGSNFLLVKTAGTINRSLDGGATFSVVPGTHGGFWLGWCDLISVAPDDENVILWGGVNLERTADGGTTWTTIGTLHSDQHQAVFAQSDPNRVYEGNDGGLYRSDDKGATWTEMSNGLVITQFYNLGDWGQLSNVLGGGTQDQGTNMTTSGMTWRNILGWDGGYLLIDPTDPRTMYAEHQSTSIFKSTDGGQNWVAKSGGLVGMSPWVGVLTMDPSNHLTLFTGKHAVFRTLDGIATNWVQSSQDLGVDVSAVAVAPSDSNRVYAGTGDLYFRAGQGKVYRSDDAGTTQPWADKTGTLPSARPVTAISVDRTNRDRVIVTYGGTNGAGSAANAVFLSTNGGNTWTDISGDLPNVSVGAAVFDPNNANTAYVGTDTGIFRTTNLGTNWLAFDNGIPNVVITDLVLDPSINMLYCSTFGRGMYKLDITPNLIKPEVDLYLRDDVLDTGERFPSPSGLPDPNDPATTVYWYESPDIKVNAPPYFMPTGVFDGVDFDSTLVHQDPQRTKLNRFYLQVHNRGWRTTTNVRVGAFIADASAGLPSLPNALTPPDFNLINTTVWQPIGAAQTIATLEPNRPVIVTWDFTVPQTTATHSCLLAVVSSPDDPITNAQTDVNVLVDTEKRVCLKNLHVIDAQGPAPGPTLVTIDFHNPLDRADHIDIVVDPRNFGQGNIGMVLPPLRLANEKEALLGVTRYPLRKDEYLGRWYVRGEPDEKLDFDRNFAKVDRSVLFEFDPTKRSEIRGIMLQPRGSIRAVISCRGASNVPYGQSQQFAVLQRQGGRIVGGGTFDVRLRRAAGLHPVSHIRVMLEGTAGLGDEFSEDERLGITVSFNDNECRTYKHEVETREEGSRSTPHERCLFDGYAAEEDRLTVSAWRIHRGHEGSEKEARLYYSHFGGPPETWIGAHSLGPGKGGPKRINYRVESLPLGSAASAD